MQALGGASLIFLSFVGTVVSTIVECHSIHEHPLLKSILIVL